MKQKARAIINEQDVKGFENVMTYIEAEQKGRGLFRFKGLGRVELYILKKVELGEGKVDMVFKTAEKTDLKKLIKALKGEASLINL